MAATAFDTSAADAATLAQFPNAAEMAGTTTRDDPAAPSGGKRNLATPTSTMQIPIPDFKPPAFETLNGIEDDPGDEDDAKPAATSGRDAARADDAIRADIRAEAVAWGFTKKEIDGLGSDKAVTTAILREAHRARTNTAAPGAPAKPAAEEVEEPDEADIELTDEDVNEKTRKAIQQGRAKLTKARNKFEKQMAAHVEKVEATFKRFDDLLGLRDFDLAIATDPDLRQVLGDDSTEDLDSSSEEAARRVRLIQRIKSTRAELESTGRRVPTIKALTKRLGRELFEKELGALKEEQTRSAADAHGRRATAARPSPAHSAQREMPPGVEKAKAAERNFWRKVNQGGR